MPLCFYKFQKSAKEPNSICLVIIASITHQKLEREMNKDIFEGDWKQLKGKIMTTWGKLTDDDINIIDGNREELSGKIQKAYGITRDAAEKQIDEWQAEQ
jgi:uncharacterized protein YjbJ (UPF0337 family)